MKVQFEIVKTLINVSGRESMHPELNLISWDGREPVIDFRKWNDDHTKMSKGCALTKEEAIELFHINREELE